MLLQSPAIGGTIFLSKIPYILRRWNIVTKIKRKHPFDTKLPGKTHERTTAQVPFPPLNSLNYISSTRVTRYFAKSPALNRRRSLQSAHSTQAREKLPFPHFSGTTTRWRFTSARRGASDWTQSWTDSGRVHASHPAARESIREGGAAAARGWSCPARLPHTRARALPASLSATHIAGSSHWLLLGRLSRRRKSMTRGGV